MSGSKLSNPVENTPHADAPLGMTVYTLPQPGDVARADEIRTRTGRLKMIMLLLICAAPVIASYLTYYVVRPQGDGRNFGQLIQPPVDMPDVKVRALTGEQLDLSSLRGQWLLVTVSLGPCDERCQHNLYFQRQLRETQGKDKDRIDRVWLIANDAPVPQGLLPALQQARVLRVDAGVLTAWLQPQSGRALEDHIYVVDPMGNWMLRFPPDMDVHSASRARRDLDRLMRASASWDNAGR